MACGTGYKTLQPHELRRLQQEALLIEARLGVNPWAVDAAREALEHLAVVRRYVRHGHCDSAKLRLKMVKHKLKAAKQRQDKPGPPPRIVRFWR